MLRGEVCAPSTSSRRVRRSNRRPGARPRAALRRRRTDGWEALCRSTDWSTGEAGSTSRLDGHSVTRDVITDELNMSRAAENTDASPAEPPAQPPEDDAYSSGDATDALGVARLQHSRSGLASPLLAPCSGWRRDEPLAPRSCGARSHRDRTDGRTEARRGVAARHLSAAVTCQNAFAPASDDTESTP